jgi:hypothetical protein
MGRSGYAYMRCIRRIQVYVVGMVVVTEVEQTDERDVE